MKKRIAAVAAMLFACVFLAGCLEIEERVSIAPTGTSEMKLKIRLPITDEKSKPEKEPKEKLEEFGKGVPGVEVTALETRSVFGQSLIEMALKAESFGALEKAYATFPKEKKEGKKESGEEVERIFSKEGFWSLKKSGNRLVITRTISNAPKKVAKKKSSKEDQSMEMMMSMMGGINFRFDLEVPGKIVSSNAESVEGSVMHWVVPLTYLQKNKVELKAEVEVTPEVMKALTGK